MRTGFGSRIAVDQFNLPLAPTGGRTQRGAVEAIEHRGNLQQRRIGHAAEDVLALAVGVDRVSPCSALNCCGPAHAQFLFAFAIAALTDFSVLFTVVSGSVWQATFGYPVGSASFPYAKPFLLSMSIVFAGIWLFSVPGRSARMWVRPRWLPRATSAIGNGHRRTRGKRALSQCGGCPPATPFGKKEAHGRAVRGHGLVVVRPVVLRFTGSSGRCGCHLRA